jgi:hypothetical protein
VVSIGLLCFVGREASWCQQNSKAGNLGFTCLCGSSLLALSSKLRVPMEWQSWQLWIVWCPQCNGGAGVYLCWGVRFWSHGICCRHGGIQACSQQSCQVKVSRSHRSSCSHKKTGEQEPWASYTGSLVSLAFQGEDSRSCSWKEHGALSSCVCQEAGLIAKQALSNGSWSCAETTGVGDQESWAASHSPHSSYG